MRRTTAPATAVLAALVMTASAPAAPGGGTEGPALSFAGFGTLGAVRASEGRADFVANVFAADGAGHSRRWSPEVDSRLGLQATAELNPRLAAVVQLIVEQRYDDSYDPTLEWAYLDLAVTAKLRLRAGRVVLPALMTSEFRKVGFANPWVRPPPEVYRLAPVTNFDGVAVSYQTHFAGFTNTLRVLYGRRDADLPDAGEVRARNGLNIANTLEHGATSVSLQYTNVEVSLPLAEPLFDALRQFSPTGRALAGRFEADDTRFELLGLGARHDPGDWFLMGEWARAESRSFLGDSRAWYITGGYRFGRLTPYLTLARVRVASDTAVAGLPLAGLAPAPAAAARALNAELNALLRSIPAQRRLSAGARWDLGAHTALKAQVDFLDLDAASPGALVNTQPDFRPGGSVSLFTVVLDFVF